MTAPYVLYGSYASYYTAKVHAYLRKKGIPFVLRLPSAPRFREHVRPTSGTHRIPQLETPDGEGLAGLLAALPTRWIERDRGNRLVLGDL